MDLHPREEETMTSTDQRNKNITTKDKQISLHNSQGTSLIPGVG